ncbi:MAG: DUF2953 domain-containing protein [Syntrophomonadaceae bacterium]|nr:DUF2953 domain-containing protein [Syntrophomonadaceae bacterium]
MLAAYIAIGGILVMVFLLLNIEVVAKYQEDGDKNGLFLEVFYLNRWFKKEYSYTHTGFRLRRFLPFIGVKKEVEEGSGDDIYERGLLIGLREAGEYLDKVLDIKRKLDEIPLLKKFYFRTLKVKELRWETCIGSVDAMQTGLLAGGAWSIKGVLMAYISNKIPVREVFLNVVPQFNREGFTTSFYCIFQLKVVHIIITSLIIRLARRSKHADQRYTAAAKPSH